jgi:gephyrin
MIATSLQKTPLAALSRPVAGTIGKTLITTLPGSVKAVRENLEALLNKGVIFHAIDLNRGGSGQQVHQALAEGRDPAAAAEATVAAHHHHHHHHEHHHAPKSRTLISNDPSLPGKKLNGTAP